MTSRAGLAAGLAAAVVFAMGVAVAGVEPDPEAVGRQSATELAEKVAADAQPAVAEMIGLPAGDPVAIEMLSRPELAAYLAASVSLEYPDSGLVKFGRCSAELGLLPEGYDLTGGMLELVGEQAGAVYDPYSKALKCLLDLPPALMSVPAQKMLVSHELCHALQDRVIDIAAQWRAEVEDSDHGYAVRAATEGMATVVMLAYFQGQPVEKAPDVQTVMRRAFDAKAKDPAMSALAAAPLYVSETLFSPYAEGGAFAQAWMRANPDLKLGALLDKLPVSAEQVLHFDKYEEGDLPTRVDLSEVESAVPEGWRHLWANTYGEFDLRMLFASHESTAAEAEKLAAGWDGCRVDAYEDSSGWVGLVGASVWDTAEDAGEFGDGLTRVLSGVHGKDFAVEVRGTWVDFVVGPFGDEATADLLSRLAAADESGK